MTRSALLVVPGSRHRTAVALLLLAHVAGALLFYGGWVGLELGHAEARLVRDLGAPLLFGSLGGLFALALLLRGAARVG